MTGDGRSETFANDWFSDESITATRCDLIPCRDYVPAHDQTAVRTIHICVVDRDVVESGVEVGVGDTAIRLPEPVIAARSRAEA
jgi:hypothetical protein